MNYSYKGKPISNEEATVLKMCDQLNSLFNLYELWEKMKKYSEPESDRVLVRTMVLIGKFKKKWEDN